MISLRRLASSLPLLFLLACSTPSTSTSTAGTSAGGGSTSASSGAGSGGVDASAPARTPVKLTTSDGLALTGYLATGSMSPAGAPGVVLIHQFQSDDKQWGDLPEALAQHGYRVLAFNLRGHGDSAPYAGSDLTQLLTDPDGAPRDVDAALAYLASSSGGAADPTRIAVVGTSIGANLAVAAAIKHQAPTCVALSARRPPTEALAGAPAAGMTSVYYLAGENDPGGQAADATTMFDATKDPRDLTVFAGTADHGIALLDNHAETRDKLFAWLAMNL